MLFKYKTKPEYHFKHFEFEIYVIETYPDYFNTENCMLRDILHYIKNFFFTFDMSKFHMVLFVLIFFGTISYDSRNLDDNLGTFFKGAHICF